MKTAPLPNNEDNGFVLWWTWFYSTMKKPVKRFNFWIYFVVCIIGFDVVGVLLSHYFPDKPSKFMSVFSYYLAIAGASCIDFIFGEDERKYIRGFSILSVGVLVLLSVFSFSGERYLFAIIATLISFILWWLANADNPKLVDVAKPTTPLGGDITKDVSGKIGNFNV